MIEINIAKDFTDTLGARTYENGPFSGQEFYEKVLKQKYEKAIAENVKLQVDLDGTNGYASSFLNEAFGRLGNDFDPKNVENNLILISNEVPKYKYIIEKSIHEKRK